MIRDQFELTKVLGQGDILFKKGSHTGGLDVVLHHPVALTNVDLVDLVAINEIECSMFIMALGILCVSANRDEDGLGSKANESEKGTGNGFRW